MALDDSTLSGNSFPVPVPACPGVVLKLRVFTLLDKPAAASNFDVLVHLVGRGQSLADASAAPRLHTEGSATLQLAKGWNDAHIDDLKQAGYTIESGSGANLNGMARDPATGAIAHVP